MVPDMLKANVEMKKVSKSKTKTVVNPEGRHNEPTWRAEFPKFYEWIFSKN
jgi:phage major head subunit gpT-like protein